MGCSCKEVVVLPGDCSITSVLFSASPAVCQAPIEQVLKGYNATILAYGQTGSGKTYTMFGRNENATRQEVRLVCAEGSYETPDQRVGSVVAALRALAPL